LRLACAGFSIVEQRRDVMRHPVCAGYRHRKLAGARRCLPPSPQSIRRPVSRVLSNAKRMPRAWRPFLCDAGCPAPEATYPDGDPDKGWIGSRLREGRSLPSLFGLAPGGVCRAVSVAGKRGALLPHRFTLAPAIRNAPWRSVLCGTVPEAFAAFAATPRRMLSGTVCPWSPDFPPRPPFG